MIQIFFHVSDIFFVKKRLRNKVQEGDVAAGAAAAVEMPHVNEVRKSCHVVAGFVGMKQG